MDIYRRFHGRPRTDHPPEAIEALKRLAVTNRDSTYVDIGVRYGYSSEALLHKADDNNNRVVGIDIDRVNIPRKLLKRERYNFKEADSVTAGVLWEPDAPVAILFIDAIHTREQVLAELWAWYPHLEPGATIVFHDTHWPVDKREMFAGRPRRRVDEAVVDFLGLEFLQATSTRDFSLSVIPSGFGMTLVQLRGKPDLLDNVDDWEFIFSERDDILRTLMSEQARQQIGALESASLLAYRSAG